MPGVTAPVLAWRPQPCNLWGLFVPRFPVLASCVQTPPGDRVAVPPPPHWSVWRTPRLSPQVPWEMCWTLPFCPQAPLAQSWRQGRVGCVGCPCGTPSPSPTLSGPSSSRWRTRQVAWGYFSLRPPYLHFGHSSDV